MTDENNCCGCGGCAEGPAAMGPFGENVPGKDACLICWPNDCKCPRIVQGTIGPIDLSRLNWSALQGE